MQNSHEPYYLAYEHRYQKAYEAGMERWGHSPEDESLLEALTKWVDAHRLQGKRIIEFACGEGACGEILSRLGCVYHGVDIAPTGLETARRALAPWPDATVSLLDMVNDRIPGTYDAALDCMGFHMLVTDSDRQKYLRNAFSCLEPGAPMLFFRESYRRDAYAGTVDSYEQWQAISGSDYAIPRKMTSVHNGCGIEVDIPLVAARARRKSGYIKEMTDTGFVVDSFVKMKTDMQINSSASIYVHKP